MGSEKLAIPDLGLPKINIKQKLTTESPRAGEVELEPVTPAGRVFQQPNLNLYILCTLGFENPINVCDFKTTLSETLAKHKRFHSIIVRIFQFLATIFCLTLQQRISFPLSNLDRQAPVVEYSDSVSSSLLLKFGPTFV